MVTRAGVAGDVPLEVGTAGVEAEGTSKRAPPPEGRFTRATMRGVVVAGVLLGCWVRAAWKRV